MDIKRLTDKGAWVNVETREDLPGSTTRVLMFIRGVGERMGTVTRIFELPWKIYDPDWMGHTEQPLTAVARYINLDSIDAKYESLRAEAAELARALDSISARLPQANMIEELKADEGYGYRMYDLKPALRDGAIVKIRELLSRPSIAELIGGK